MGFPLSWFPDNGGLARRRADAAELGRRQGRASRRARTKPAPITAPGELQDTTTITARGRPATSVAAAEVAGAATRSCVGWR